MERRREKTKPHQQLEAAEWQPEERPRLSEMSAIFLAQSHTHTLAASLLFHHLSITSLLSDLSLAAMGSPASNAGQLQSIVPCVC